MKRHTMVLMAAVLVMAAFLAACGGGASSGGTGAALNVTVTTTEFKFDPATINATPGQTINLTVKNSGSIDHTWVLAASNVKLTIAAGKTETKTFTAPSAAGTYPITCDVAGHKEAGMTGQLIVK